MSGNPLVLGAKTTATGVAGVALLPNTGSYRAIFITAAAIMAVGLVIMIVSGATAFARRSN